MIDFCEVDALYKKETEEISLMSKITKWLTNFLKEVKQAILSKTMPQKTFKEISIESPVEIMGHVFPNLKAVRKAVGKCARITESTFYGRTIYDETPERCPEGLYVLQMFEPYPCFDSYDYAYEDRVYSNYFFSDKPFTEQQIEVLAHFKPAMNFSIITEQTPEWAFPCIFYVGCGDKMIVATLE